MSNTKEQALEIVKALVERFEEQLPFVPKFPQSLKRPFSYCINKYVYTIDL